MEKKNVKLTASKLISDGVTREQAYGIAAVALSVFSVYCVIWAFTDVSFTTSAFFNTYVLQARRWLEGHLDLGQNYTSLELAIYEGKYYCSFPPIPSVILLPFCIIFKDSVPDYAITTIIGIIGAVYAYKIVYLYTAKNKLAIFMALFATIGGNFIHIGYTGDVWYIAQVCGFTFTMMALYYAATKGLRSGWAPLFLLALAFGCRPLQIVYTPLVMYLLYKKLAYNDIKIADGIKRFWWWALPALAVGIFLMILNAARFGNPFQFGHDYLPEFMSAEDGQFSVAYLWENLKRMFDLPEIVDGVVEFPRFNGCALWLISPIFLAYMIYFVSGIKRNYKRVIPWAVIALALLHMILLCCHKTLGGSQFGNRYTVDMIPVILFGIGYMLRDEKRDFSVINYPMFFWGLGINLVGTIGYVLGYLV